MKVLAVIHDFLPRHQAGSELYCFYLCKELRKRGHEVRILCTEIDHRRPPYSVRERTYDGLPVTEIVQHFHFRRFEETYKNSAVERIFGDQVRSWRPDVVHFHHLLGLSFDCPRLARAAGAAVVFTLHDYWLLCLRGGGQRFLDDGTVCHEIQPENCSACVAEFGLLSHRPGRWVKQTLIRLTSPGEMDLREHLKRAKISTAERPFVQPTELSIDGISLPAILAHPPSSITYRLPNVAGMRLLFSYAMVPSTYDKPGEGVVFRVKFDGSLLWESYLDAKHREEDRGWHTHAVEIPHAGGELTLQTGTGPSANRDFCAAVWGHPRIVSKVKGAAGDRTTLVRAGFAGRSILHALFSRSYRRQARKRMTAALSMAESVDCFICPSRFLRTTFADHGFPTDKLLFSDYGIPPLPDIDSQGDQYGVSTRSSRPGVYPVRFVYIGSLVRHKGVHVLIRAFNELPPEKAVLRIYGPLDEFVDYVRMVQSLVRNPSVEFCGRFENRDLVRILREADVLVVPSIWFENSPITIHEAFLAGVPVVTARFGGMGELVSDGENGLLFEVGDVHDLRRVLSRFVDEPGLVEKLRPDPSSVKSMEENVEEMESLYRSLSLRGRM